MLFFPYIRICQFSLISDCRAGRVLDGVHVIIFFLLFHLLIKTACKQVAHVIFCNGRWTRRKQCLYHCVHSKNMTNPLCHCVHSKNMTNPLYHFVHSKNMTNPLYHLCSFKEHDKSPVSLCSFKEHDKSHVSLCSFNKRCLVLSVFVHCNNVSDFN
jgi:hypothetical protein